jgi:hypothetical protein
MMMAGVGGRKEVRGKRIAIPEVGPMPGRTPTRVPSTDPIRAKKRFVGVMAWAKPFIKRSKVDIFYPVRGFRFPTTRLEGAYSARL